MDLNNCANNPFYLFLNNTIYRKPLEVAPYTDRENSVMAHGSKPENFRDPFLRI